MFNKSTMATVLGTALLGLMKSKGGANLTENENSWGIRLAMLKGFLSLDKQDRERIMPPTIEDRPRSLYDDQEYGAPYFNEMSEKIDVSSHLKGCWLDDFKEDSYPWQTLITEKDGEIQFWEFWSSECFEGLKTKPRYSKFMQGNISNWDIGKIIEVFDNDFNSILSPLGYEVSKTEIIPLRVEFISITYIKRVKNGSKSLINPKKLQKSIDVDCTFYVRGLSMLDLNDTGEPDEEYVERVLKGKMASIVKYSKKWQEQMSQVKDKDLTAEQTYAFFANNPPESEDDEYFIQDFSVIENDYDFDYMIKYVFVFKNLLDLTNFEILEVEFSEYSVTIKSSLKIKIMNSQSLMNLLDDLIDMVLWNTFLEDFYIKQALVLDEKMNDHSKKFVLYFNDSELRRF